MSAAKNVLLALSLAVSAPASAQTTEFLTRGEIEAHMLEAVFCYHPDARLACAWAELYTALNPDHAVLQSASAVWPEPMSVVEFRVEWRGDALCVDDATQGLLAAREAEGYRFPFNLQGLTLLPAEGLPALIAEFRAVAPVDACFRYSDDPARPGQLLQHSFHGDAALSETDPVLLVPLGAGAVAINPG